MYPNAPFRDYIRTCFARLVRGYANALDDTGCRAWINGHMNATDAGGCFDATTRMFPALCAYLTDPARPAILTHRGQNLDLRELVRVPLANLFDPANPGFIGRDAFPPIDQRTVESSPLAYGVWLLRDHLADLPQPVLARFADWLAFYGSQAYPSNWQLFLIVNQAVRKALGWPHDQAVIDRAWDVINACERADGWMTDGPEGYFDDYNWWVFGTHELWWTQIDGASNPALVERIRARIRRRLEDFPYFFAADGSYTEYGRSLSYKFGRLGCAILAYKLGLWPHSVGMLQRLIRRHLAWYDHMGAIDRHTDLVRQELSAHGCPDVRDPYINTGHPYWCMLAFASLWQLPDADPLWTCPEEPLPVEAADFTRTISPAGWILCGTKAGGHVLRYALGSRHAEATYAPYHAKYSKFCYGSHFPVNLAPDSGSFGPDAALCLTNFNELAHPGVYSDLTVGDGCLAASYQLTLNDQTLDCRTTLVPFGEVCIRFHAITVRHRHEDLFLLEGASPLGFSPGELPRAIVSQNPPLSAAILGQRASAIHGFQGYNPTPLKTHYVHHLSALAPGRHDHRGHNAVYADAHLPCLRSPVLSSTLQLISITLTTLSGYREFWRDLTITPNSDATITVRCQTRQRTLANPFAT